jgi:septum formation protein
MKSSKTIILASQSRDRKRLFSNAKIPHVVIVSEYEEKLLPGLSSKELALFHACGKALSVQKMIETNRNLISTMHFIIISADTVVDIEGEILGKSKNKSHAIEMLRKLMGKTHLLITGVVVYDSESDSSVEHIDTTEVRFASLTEEEISDYVTYGDEYKWRAGSYSMFDRASVFIESISGSPSNVIGLPMHFIYNQLKMYGVNLLRLSS